jgi:hypothetical protein
VLIPSLLPGKRSGVDRGDLIGFHLASIVDVRTGPCGKRILLQHVAHNANFSASAQARSQSRESWWCGWVRRETLLSLESKIGTKGDGSNGLTDSAGKARIPLAPQTKPGTKVPLQILSPPNLLLVSPWEGNAIVTSFENDSSNYIDLIVISFGDKRALEDAAVVLSVATESQKRRNAAPPNSPRPKKSAISVSPRTRPLVLAFQQASQVESMRSGSAEASSGALISEEVAVKLGFTQAEMARAIESLNPDSLVWKIGIVSGASLNGGDPFSSAFTDGVDIYFGLGHWEVLSGELQTLLRGFRKADPQRFDAIMGKDVDLVRNWLGVDPFEALKITIETLLHGKPNYYLPEPWRTRFTELGRYPPFQQVQLDSIAPLVKQAVEKAGQLGFRSERAVACLHNVVWGFANTYSDLEPAWASVPGDSAGFAPKFGR